MNPSVEEAQMHKAVWFPWDEVNSALQSKLESAKHFALQRGPS
jgi:hypothetical protein